MDPGMTRVTCTTVSTAEISLLNFSSSMPRPPRLRVAVLQFNPIKRHNVGSCPSTSGEMGPVCSSKSQSFNGEWLHRGEQDRCKATGGYILPVYKSWKEGEGQLYQETLNRVSSTGQDVLKGENGDWSVTALHNMDDFRPQVKKVAVAMGASLTEQDIERMPRGMKTQGAFNYSRFLEYMRQFKTSEEREDAIKKAFMKLDKDSSGYIEWNEIKYILSTVPTAAPSAPLSDEEAEAVIQAADTDGDGRIDYRGEGLFNTLVYFPVVTTKEFSDMVKMEKKPRK
ncbi:Parvalbumin alpha [Nibea albiflora]|uniref:Parvalbumin alpha n=1 Tax=Nibea albiflora TaxID=240163 RepID=A0ACB7F385_NIBAL|nr:Parvalbumin alpha [Nibea albiflora]